MFECMPLSDTMLHMLCYVYSQSPLCFESPRVRVRGSGHTLRLVRRARYGYVRELRFYNAASTRTCTTTTFVSSVFVAQTHKRLTEHYVWLSIVSHQLRLSTRFNSCGCHNVWHWATGSGPIPPATQQTTQAGRRAVPRSCSRRWEGETHHLLLRVFKRKHTCNTLTGRRHKPVADLGRERVRQPNQSWYMVMHGIPVYGYRLTPGTTSLWESSVIYWARKRCRKCQWCMENSNKKKNAFTVSCNDII